MRATPSGFLKMRDTTTTTTCNSEPSPSHGQGRQGGRSGDNVWSMGHNYGELLYLPPLYLATNDSENQKLLNESHPE